MGRWIAGLGSEVRIALRGLLRSPEFSAVAIVTLALGLGGCAAIYSLLNRVVFDPLPYPQAERLVGLRNAVPGVASDAEWNMSTAQYVHLVDQSAALEEVGLYRGFGANIQTPEGPRRSSGWRLTASVFRLLGARPVVGRLINAADDRPDGKPVVVLSHGFWRQQFGEDSSVIGRTIRINDGSYEVIGVLEPGVRMPGSPPGFEADLWIPMQIDPDGYFGNNHVFPMFARLAPGYDPATAETEIERLTTQLPDRFSNAYSTDFFQRYGFHTRVRPLKEQVIGSISRNLWILFGAVGLVLLIATANVANLFLVRMDGRQNELAIRSALGAGPAELARHILAESWILCFAGGALALLLGFWGVPALLEVAPNSLPRVEALTLDRAAVAFTALLCVVLGLLIAAYPLVRRQGGVGWRGGLTAGSRSLTAAGGRQRLRAGLVVAQLALALTLVTGAWLLVESMRRLNSIDPGVEPQGMVTAGVFLTPERYANDAAVWTAHRQILERVRALPGVEAAGMTEELPVLGGFGCTVQAFGDSRVYDRLRDAGMTTCAGQEATTPGYFEAAGIPLLRGRPFTDSDNDNPSQGAVVVSRAFAERFWPGEDPLGKRVAPNGRTEGPFYEVVGMVGDVPARALDGETAIAIYYPIVHQPDTIGSWGGWQPVNMSLVVRTGLPDPTSLAPQIRRAVQEVDASIPVAHVASMEEIIAESTARYQFTSLLLGIAAGVALLLAVVGLYGMVSYVVGRRQREIGIRIAIGAHPAVVSRSVIRRSMRLVAIGLAVGLAIALATTRLIGGLLYGVQPTDIRAFLGAAVVLAAVALVASWIPARRAARVDPARALRAE
jgi:putative ABC transport system permease protein